MLWMALALWLGLGLGRKPEDRPEVEEGERDGAALLLGVLKGLLEAEQPRAGSCRTVGWLLTCFRLILLPVWIEFLVSPECVCVSHLFAPSAGQLLLCRHRFRCWSLLFGLFVWVEADFLHLGTNRANSLKCPYNEKTG